jgi:hypothetical protein
MEGTKSRDETCNVSIRSRSNGSCIVSYLQVTRAARTHADASREKQEKKGESKADLILE